MSRTCLNCRVSAPSSKTASYCVQCAKIIKKLGIAWAPQKNDPHLIGNYIAGKGWTRDRY